MIELGFVVGVAGRIASGKTTLSSQLAASLGCSMTSFSRFLRDKTTEAGLDPSRSTLQELGAQWADRGWMRFCRAVLEHAGWDRGQLLVLDGIRHSEVATALRRAITPDRLVLIYVDEPPMSEWRSRLSQKGIESVLELEGLEQHPAEGDVTNLRDEADLVLKSSAVSDMVSEVVNFLERWRGG